MTEEKARQKKLLNEDATTKKVSIKRHRKRVYETTTETEDNSKSTDNNINSKVENISQTPSVVELDNTIMKYIILSVGTGTIPFPVFDLVAIVGIQLKMVSELSEKYGIPFSENISKSIILSLLGSLAPLEIVKGIVGTTSKHIPGLGTLMGTTLLASLSGASTYAVGKVFIKHFESNGTFLNYDLEKMKVYFSKQYSKSTLGVASFMQS